MDASPVSTERAAEPPEKRHFSRGERLRGMALALILLLAASARYVAVQSGNYRLSLFSIPLLFSVTVFAAVRLVRERRERRERLATEPAAVRSRAPAAILAGLGAGWQAIYRVELGRERIDAVLVGPAGAFVAEVEARLGRIDVDRLDPGAVARAVAHGEAIERISGLPVRPLLVFADGHLPDAPVAVVDGVTVVPAPVLATYLDRLPVAFDEAEVGEVGEALRLALEVDAPVSA